MVVRVDIVDMVDPVVGGQFFMSYDSSILEFITATPGDEPFTRELGIKSDTPGKLFYAVGIENEGTGTTADTTMAYLVFHAVNPDCATTSLVTINAAGDDGIPSRLSAPHGVEIVPALEPLPAFTVDGEAPDLTVPDDISVHSDAGECQATFATLAMAEATDNCDPEVTITFARSDEKEDLLDPYEAADSPITITWTAEDDCGNTATDAQVITVSAQNEILVDVELQPDLSNVGTLNRCVTFQLWACPAGSPAATVGTVVAFPANGSPPHRANNVSVLAPCGVYTCMTARGKLHTLRSKAPNFSDDGATYSATFVGNRSAGGHWLIGGNVNDDSYIDILDYSSVQSRLNTNYGTGNTTCSTQPYHCDINGDGWVLSADLSFVQKNLFKAHEANCCSGGGGSSPMEAPDGDGPSMADDGSAEEATGPVYSISLADLLRMGDPNAAAADVTRDGVVDWRDLDAAGQRLGLPAWRPEGAED